VSVAGPRRVVRPECSVRDRPQP